MEWNLSPEQDAYREAFRGWLTDMVPPDAVRRWLDAGDMAAFETLFADGAGLASVSPPNSAAAPSAGWLRRGRPSSTRPP